MVQSRGVRHGSKVFGVPGMSTPIVGARRVARTTRHPRWTPTLTCILLTEGGEPQKNKEILREGRSSTDIMWSSLPTDLVDSIEESLVLYIDKVRLRCVCSSWRSHLPKLSNHSVVGPWLLLPDNLGSKTCGFWNPLEKNVYKLDLPEAGDQIAFKGSDHGWVVIHDKKDAIYALNPLTRARVWLPPRSKFPDIREYNAHNQDNEYQLWEGIPDGDGCYNFKEYYSLGATHVRNSLLQKVVFSSSPTCSDFVAVAIFGEYAKLAYCKRGDNKWSLLDEDIPLMEDLLFHGGKLYGVQHLGRLVVFDNIMNAGSNSCPKPKFKDIVPTRLLLDNLYLCWSSSTGLMLVRRDMKYDDVDEYDEHGDQIITLETVGFEIFKLDTIAQTWCEVKSLGDDVLFLGLNSTISFSSLDFPSYKRNCIYFTDTQLNFQIKGTGRDLDVGAFSLDEEKFEHFRAYVGDSKSVWPSPIWVVPSPFN
ncbi:hypothetical protein F2P56_035361 [Juglans regia]|uniref:WW domain-containing protein n=2 Tax=Juglans regia TaxID=51240 RepID=A0A833WTG1_JUGRE|nr:F-box protein SKIP23-like [Juglans regia]KAF5442736.1 hypothetical protein F2P56_035361 [Juglans regia]